MRGLVRAATLIACLTGPLLAGDNDCPVDTIDGRFYCKPCDEYTVLDMTCKRCKSKTELVLLCIRKGFACKACDVWSHSKGDCASCKKPLVESESLARLIYVCDACKKQHDLPGLCDGCKGADLRKTCNRSGTCPHTAK